MKEVRRVMKIIRIEAQDSSKNLETGQTSEHVSTPCSQCHWSHQREWFRGKARWKCRWGVHLALRYLCYGGRYHEQTIRLPIQVISVTDLSAHYSWLSWATFLKSCWRCFRVFVIDISVREAENILPPSKMRDRNECEKVWNRVF